MQATNCEFVGNAGAWRMDHVAENVVLDGCRFEDNSGKGPIMYWETAIGPITVQNTKFLRNTTKADGIVCLSTAHNVTFDGCTFDGNLPAAFALYPRSRAHTPVKKGEDEMCNNMDMKSWDRNNTTEGRWGPGGKKPAAFNRNLVIHDCVFRADDETARFFTQERYRRNEAYVRTIRDEISAWNNAYWNPKNPTAFLVVAEQPAKAPSERPGHQDRPSDFAAWRAQSRRPGFEAGSVWGERVTNPVQATKIAAMKSGNDPMPKVVAGALRYEAANLPFTATKAVLPWTIEGQTFHHLQVDQIGEYGDRITYEITVPTAGTYTVALNYLQNATPFRYLGFAQVLIDDQPVGQPIDQSGLVTRVITAPVESVTLTAGRHRVTFASVHRNGYTSGDYDLTIGAIELRAIQALQPAVSGAGTELGLTTAVVANWRAGTLATVDWTKLSPVAATNPTMVVATPGAQRQEGFLTIPADGLWTLSVEVVGAAQVFLNDELVIDSDGMHWGEKDDPWRKHAVRALAKGPHRFRVEALAQSGKPKLLLGWSGPQTPQQPIPHEAFTHAP